MPAGTRSNAAANSVIVCATVNEVTMADEIPAQAAERHHHAEQKQKVVESAENVGHPGLHEDPGSPLPTRIQRDRGGGSAQQVNSLGSTRRQETHVDGEPITQLGSRVERRR